MARVVSASLLVVLVLGILVWLPAWATLVASIGVAGLAAGELAGLAARAGTRVSALFVGTAAALVVLAFSLDNLAVLARVPALHAVILSLIVAAGAMALAAGADGGALTRAGVLLMAPLYVGLPLGVIATLRATDGPGAVLFLIALVAASDSAQFYSGRLLGRRQLAPVVSPGKTVEGLVGGLVAAAIVAAAAGPRLLPATAVPAVLFAVLGVALALAGVLGDLFESLLKRGAGVKDSSALIPGHGGVLDRVDSYLLAAPVFYLFMRLFA